MEQMFEITITGSATSAQLATALRLLARQIQENEHVSRVNETGECVWEDNVIMTQITLA